MQLYIYLFLFAFLVLSYSLRNKNEDDVCDELVLMLTDVLNRELSGVGPEDILSESQLEELHSALDQEVMIITIRA